jgi:hypothetical protein
MCSLGLLQTLAATRVPHVRIAWVALIALLWSVALEGCAGASPTREMSSYVAQRNREIRALLASPTASDFATAAMLAASSIRPRPTLALETAAKAVALAPKAADLAWLQLRICEQLRCRSAARLRERFAALAPDNGLAREDALVAAEAADSPASVIAALQQIASAGHMTVYWTRLEVRIDDAFKRTRPSQDVVNRFGQGIGVVAAFDIPPLQPFARACNDREISLSGRRAACQAVMTRLEHSDTVIMPRTALEIEAWWWPAGSPQARALAERRREPDYLLLESSRVRFWSMRRDAALRIRAARHAASEQAVERAVLAAHHLPATPPPEWKDPWIS